jgi:CCR4-NOT transcriptional complex subunit CAF120
MVHACRLGLANHCAQIDKMPTRSPDIAPLTNVLSISSAGRNRYLFHFNSHHSLVQWTASIRLCMFEHSKLQEIYTGALIAAKGKTLNAIGQITAKTNFKYEDWVRVRFGAGTPWRKCWAVISQPDEKIIKKAKAAAKKAKNTAYPQHPVFKGDIKFYDTKKTKKQSPIATIVDAYAAYALYPQSKQMIEVSTLIKIEGRVIIHGDQPTESEGYVFVMPDIHPAVSGFETMLRFLFPTYDTFALYGRPGMLIPDKTDPRSLMFAMPIDTIQSCGYLDVVDVVNVVVAGGNALKLESEWRDRLKDATKEKITMLIDRKSRPRASMPPVPRLNLGTGSSTWSPVDLPPQHVPLTPGTPAFHQRSTSEATGLMNYRGQQPPSPYFESPASSNQFQYGKPPSTGHSDSSSDGGLFAVNPAARHLQQQTTQPPIEPVPVTPRTLYPPGSQPPQLPQLPMPNLDSGDEDLFAGVVPRRGSVHQDSQRPPSRGSRERLNGNHPTPITQDRDSDQIEAPPGFALQSSHVVLRGPPPTGDEKVAYDEEYANHPPPGRPMSQDYTNQLPPAPQYTEHRRSWQPTPPSGSPSPDRETGEMFPTPPLPQVPPAQERASMAAKHNSWAHPPPINTNVAQQRQVMSVVTEHDTPDSVTDLPHLIDQSALDKIGPQRQPSNAETPAQPDEDTFDRRTIARIQKVLAGGDSDSEYGDEPEDEEEDDDEPDYASSVDSRLPPAPTRDANGPRAGVMKVVGQKPEPEVVIGDVHYRPSSSGKPLEPAIDIPKVDFGMTVSHGRTLSSDLHMKNTSRGSVAAVEPDVYPSSAHGTIGGSTPMLANGAGGHSRSPSAGLGSEYFSRQPTGAVSRSSGSGSGEYNRPSPGSDSDASRRRTVAWQPAIVTPGGNYPPDQTAAERYVAEKAAQATNQSRSRYLNARKASSSVTPQRNQSSEYLPPTSLPTRPSSRGPNAAFTPGGLISTPDLSSHLSAREMEYIARKTGSTLLHMDESQLKAPPHKTGLIGAIQSRETERKQIKGSFQRGVGSLTVQQEIARRQQEKAAKEQAMQAAREQRRRTPSPRIMFEQQQQYFPQQNINPPMPPQMQLQLQMQQIQQMQQQQQQQQQQQMFLAQQQQQQQMQQMQMQQQQQMGAYGYPNHQSQGGRTPDVFQNQYYSRN